MTEHRAQYDTAPIEPETIGEILPDVTQSALSTYDYIQVRPRTHYDGCYRVHPECALAKIQEIENERDAATKLLRDSNSLLRSAYQVAARRGKETNWDAFLKQLENELQAQHNYLQK